VAVTMHGRSRFQVAGICTMSVTLRPLPSSENRRYSVPATLPSPRVSLPAMSMLGPNRVP
jgi:hypothetical protein